MIPVMRVISAVLLCDVVFLVPTAFGQDLDCCDAPVAVGFAAARVSSPLPRDGWVDESGACLASGGEIRLGGPPGSEPLVAVAVTLSSNGAGGGVSAWSLSVAVDGDVEIVSVRSPRDSDPCLLLCVDCCPEPWEIVDPSRNEGQRGVVVAGAAFEPEDVLPATGTEWVLEIVLAPSGGLADGESRGVVRLHEGLGGATGPPIQNVAVFDGTTVAPCNAADAEVSIVFEATSPHGFVRGDANNDASVDIADVIWILSALFRDGARGCDAAADSNGDARRDLSDAVYVLDYLFLGGWPPPAPFPACGVVAGGDCDSAQKACL